ncbi:helix-turn-helix domain-containing protein [Bauldia sp.]|uniref:helix-turn-helix domain-containing protein n=1 Tax=Bauldia sp. TaxID=2575872 RepID=UPI003BA9F1F6
MRLAKQMLGDDKAAIADIAEATGYGSETAFGRAVKRRTGATPAAWQSLNRPA